MNYLNELNEPQRKAVECTEGPVMIVAGAGSGKTRVLTYRIAHLLHKDVDAFNILALTFTNKAARAMKERITKIVGNTEAKNLWMGTFHSVFARILRFESEKLGYPTHFTIYDTDDSKSLIKTILREQGIDDKVYKPSMVLSRISYAKNNLISSVAYANNHQISEDDRMSGKPKMGLIYEIYARRCFKAGAMDFDDLLYQTNILLRDFPVVLNKYQLKFKYILVDEYQDTNFSQYVIVKQLAAKFENICVVGDDAQSIYAFRGANIQNILNFEKDYPDLNTFKLEQNYRSTKNIVNAANKIISNNKEQLQKTVWTDNPVGEKIKVTRAETDNAEGLYVANTIFEVKMNKQANNRAFAVLYRTNAQSRAMEEALRKKNIYYKVFGGMSFYQRKEIKDLLAYFRLTINNHDEEALKRVINFPARGIGDTTLNKIMLAASDHGVSTWTVIDNLNDFNLGINSGTTEKINDFSTLIKTYSGMLKVMNAYDLGEHIATSSGVLKEMYNDKTPEGVSRYENIQELLNGLKEFSEKGEKEIELPDDLDILDSTISPSHSFDSAQDDPQGEGKITRTLNLYMRDIALLTDLDKNEEKDERDFVSLMTVHASKGLEFPYVFIVGMEENLFPSQFALNSRAELEEERRLFYVALTRAEKQAFISMAETRYKWGNLINCEPSRFIDEIDGQYLDFPEPVAKKEKALDDDEDSFLNPVKKLFRKEKKKSEPPPPPVAKNLVKMNIAKSASTQGANNNEHLKDLQTGMEVYHERFGNGKVMNIEGVFPNSKATVEFEGTGQKQLLLKFAKLKIMN